LVGILESFLGSCQSSSCQHALSNFSYTDICILLSVRFVILLKCLHFFRGPNGCILQSSPGNLFLLILISSRQFFLLPMFCFQFINMSVSTIRYKKSTVVLASTRLRTPAVGTRPRNSSGG
jgi:hypothetical protein